MSEELNLKPLAKHTPEEWMALTQAEQLSLYNDSVYNLGELFRHMTRLSHEVRTQRDALMERAARKMGANSE
jgi:hypothetical protein